jgi:outer membrane immunogenic protein
MTGKRKLLAGAAALAIFAGLNGVDDAAADPPYDWTGFTVGLHAAAGAVDFEGHFRTDAPVFGSNVDMSGMGGGVHGGFNYQLTSLFAESAALVIGVEGDVTVADWEDFTCNGVSQCVSGDLELLASVRGRLGVAIESVLVFATGGIAFADARATFRLSSDPNERVKFNDVGGVVGGGVDIALTESVSFRSEFLYYIFRDRQDTSGLNGGGPGQFFELDNVYVVRAGVTIKLSEFLNGGFR